MEYGWINSAIESLGGVDSSGCPALQIVKCPVLPPLRRALFYSGLAITRFMSHLRKLKINFGDSMKITTWNINSVRLRLPLIKRFAEEIAPDKIGRASCRERV